MSRGWCAVAVSHEISVDAADGTSAAPPAVEAVPGAMLTVEVIATNHLDESQPGLFRLVGLGRPLIARVAAIDARSAQPRRLEFALPERLGSGRNPATVEWVEVGMGRTDRLAATDLVVVVDDVSTARIEVAPKLVKGLLGAKTKVLLENNGARPITLSLDSSTPRGSRVRIDLSPEVVRLEPGQLCHAVAYVRRRSRWFGAQRTHVFDIHARGASGSVTSTGTFRQYTVFPPVLFKAIAAIVAVVLAAVLLLRLVRSVVDDNAPSSWESIGEPPEDLVGRSGHTATWMSFERRDASTGREGALTRTRELITGADDSVRGVLVWGGVDDDGRPIGAGAIYSVTDAEWLSVSAPPGDEARAGHTAVWTGERVVIWGGAVAPPGDPGGVAARGATPFYGAEYDPTTDNWDPLPPSGLEPRIGHSMIWTGRELIVFGGIAADGRVLSDGGILRAGRVQSDGSSTAEDEADLSAGVWSLFQVGDLGATQFPPRAYHSAAWDGRYMVITGGIGADGSLLADAYAYEVAHNRWNLMSLASFEPRACHRSVATGSGIVIIGGLGVPDLADPEAGDPAPDGVLCHRAVVGAERDDPTAWNLTLEPNPEARHIPLYEWTVLHDAPAHLGTDFEAAWTGSAVGIALIVPELDSVAPISYVPGAGSTIGALPDAGQLDVSSELTAAWNGSELFVWGGRREHACDEPDQDDECLAANGAVIDVGA